jgi:hypothetical protein
MDEIGKLADCIYNLKLFETETIWNWNLSLNYTKLIGILYTTYTQHTQI